MCRHQPHRVIDWIREPKYSTDEVLIKTAAIYSDVEHYIIKFTDCTKYPEWFYMSGKVIRRHHKQKNGGSEVYVVPMSKRESFEPITHCDHEY